MNPPLPPPPRLDWVDYARGLGILLVVAGHTVRGNLVAGLLPDSAAARLAEGWIYAFHMPLFFVLSGLFAERSAARGAGRFVADKLRTVAYPYLVWSAVQVGFQAALSGYTNTPASWRDVAAVVYQPPMQFWFLYALFGCFLLYLAGRGAGLGRWGFLLAAVAGAVLQWRVDLGPWGVVYQTLSNLPYFALGVAAAGPVRAAAGAAGWPAGLLAAAAGYGLLTALVLVPGVLGVFRVPAALLGVAASLALAAGLARLRVLAVVRVWGEQSMPIFVAHTLASAGFRIALQKLAHVTDPTVHLVGGVAAGLYGPILLAAVARRAGFRYLVSWPERRPAGAAVGRVPAPVPEVVRVS